MATKSEMAMALNSAHFAEASGSAGRLTDARRKFCEALTVVLAGVEAVQAATPTWKVWHSGRYAVVIGVLRGFQRVACDG